MINFEKEFLKFADTNINDAEIYDIEDFIEVMAQDRPEFIKGLAAYLNETFASNNEFLTAINERIEEVKDFHSYDDIEQDVANAYSSKEGVRKMPDIGFDY